jgi:ribosomal protein L37AE/L43A
VYCKTCLECGQNSYSASSEATWHCPFCQHDLTKQPAKIPECERLTRHLADNQAEIVKVKIE